MPPLAIPDQYRHGLAELLHLSEHAASELLDALRNLSPVLAPSELQVKLAASLPTLDPATLESIVDTLLSLYIVRDDSPLSAEQLAAAVTDAMIEGDYPDLKLTAKSRDRFQSRLAALLDVDALSIASRARGVLSAYERHFCTARVITDIRPVFGNDATAQPIALSLVHTIHFTYHHGGDLENISFTMSPNDIRHLLATLERATQKESSLKRVVESTGIPYLDRLAGVS